MAEMTGLSKTCTKCGEEKALTEFYTHSNNRDGRLNTCKQCRCAYEKRRRASLNTEQRVALSKVKRKSAHRMRARKRQAVWDYLLEHPCVDCGERDPVVLEFDHVRGDKTYNISQMAISPKSSDDIWREIAKCEVRCANCHRKVTAARAGWYKNIDKREDIMRVIKALSFSLLLFVSGCATLGPSGFVPDDASSAGDVGVAEGLNTLLEQAPTNPMDYAGWAVAALAAAGAGSAGAIKVLKKKKEVKVSPSSEGKKST